MLLHRRTSKAAAIPIACTFLSIFYADGSSEIWTTKVRGTAGTHAIDGTNALELNPTYTILTCRMVPSQWPSMQE